MNEVNIPMPVEIKFEDIGYILIYIQQIFYTKLFVYFAIVFLTDSRTELKTAILQLWTMYSDLYTSWDKIELIENILEITCTLHNATM